MEDQYTKPLRDTFLQDAYDKIYTIISNGTLFGEKINVYDIRELVVSAFESGLSERVIYNESK